MTFNSFIYVPVLFHILLVDFLDIDLPMLQRLLELLQLFPGRQRILSAFTSNKDAEGCTA